MSAGVSILRSGEELVASIDNLSRLNQELRDRLALAVGLLTAEQLEKYKAECFKVGSEFFKIENK